MKFLTGPTQWLKIKPCLPSTMISFILRSLTFWMKRKWWSFQTNFSNIFSSSILRITSSNTHKLSKKKGSMKRQSKWSMKFFKNHLRILMRWNLKDTLIFLIEIFLTLMRRTFLTLRMEDKLTMKCLRDLD